MVRVSSPGNSVERGKRLKSKRKHIEDDRVDVVERDTCLKSERKHVEGDLADGVERALKSERKHVEDDGVERGMQHKSEQKYVSRSEYKKKAQIRKEQFRIKARIREEKIRNAMANYKRRSENLTPFDAIASPAIAHLGGGVSPISINANRSILTRLSKIALEKYNADNNQDPKFVFDELVKSTLACCSGGMYYITFKAKQCASNNPATIFQAKVWNKRPGPPEVMSCAIKTD
ncbi:uncharacterized protein LOC131655904 [Vicia villosa]|uniref:uncharacterized protein LOC131655904 n=1 Tax=Vicia villosa TaxID=3911 RepID=UPI00273B995A|nr:uncharacterized protein LOC131655904 [Vicia villosa]